MQAELFHTEESTMRKCITNGEPVKVALESIKINLAYGILDQKSGQSR